MRFYLNQYLRFEFWKNDDETPNIKFLKGGYHGKNYS